MAFVLIVLATALLALICGGRIRNLIHVKFRFAWLALIAVALKFATHTELRYTLGLTDSLALKGYMVSLFLIAVFLVLNIRLYGLAFIGLGFIGNALAIAFNGGYMPVKREYVGLIASAEDLEKINQGLPAFNYVATGPDTKFYYFSDIFLMPEWISFTKVFSIGDVFITLGGSIFIWYYLRSSQLPHKINRYTIPY